MLDALDSGHLSRATLDVTFEEPLPRAPARPPASAPMDLPRSSWGHCGSSLCLRGGSTPAPPHALRRLPSPPPTLGAAESPLWLHPKVRLTPHVAGSVSEGEGAKIAVESWRQLRRGGALSNVLKLHGGTSIRGTSLQGGGPAPLQGGDSAVQARLSPLQGGRSSLQSSEPPSPLHGGRSSRQGGNSPLQGGRSSLGQDGRSSSLTGRV